MTSVVPTVTVKGPPSIYIYNYIFFLNTDTNKFSVYIYIYLCMYIRVVYGCPGPGRMCQESAMNLKLGVRHLVAPSVAATAATTQVLV